MGLRSDLEGLDASVWTDGRINIAPLKTQDDLVYACCECELTEGQKELVNPAWFSIGRAYLFPENDYPCVIRNERNERIGFISFRGWSGADENYSWSFFIDVRHQGKGFGRRAAELAVRILKTAAPDKTIKLATEKSNEKAQKLYLSLGFRLLDELDGDDLIFGL